MYKFVVLFRKVDDMAALEAFFSGTYLPLAEQMSGVIRHEVSRVGVKPGGQSRFHLMSELYFADEAVFRAGLRSAGGLALLGALHPWAEKRLLTWFDAECWADQPRPGGPAADPDSDPDRAGAGPA